MNTCAWPTCREVIKPRHWLCDRHWPMLDARLRAAIYAVWRPLTEYADPGDLPGHVDHVLAEARLWITEPVPDSRLRAEFGEEAAALDLPPDGWVDSTRPWWRRYHVLDHMAERDSLR